MGWSLDLIIDDIHRLFGKNLHEVVAPEADRPYARISYNREIPLALKRKICELFPPDYRIFFHPGTVHEEPAPSPVAMPKESSATSEPSKEEPSKKIVFVEQANPPVTTVHDITVKGKIK